MRRRILFVRGILETVMPALSNGGSTADIIKVVASLELNESVTKICTPCGSIKKNTAISLQKGFGVAVSLKACASETRSQYASEHVFRVSLSEYAYIHIY